MTKFKTVLISSVFTTLALLSLAVFILATNYIIADWFSIHKWLMFWISLVAVFVFVLTGYISVNNVISKTKGLIPKA